MLHDADQYNGLPNRAKTWAGHDPHRSRKPVLWGREVGAPHIDRGERSDDRVSDLPKRRTRAVAEAPTCTYLLFLLLPSFEKGPGEYSR